MAMYKGEYMNRAVQKESDQSYRRRIYFKSNKSSFVSKGLNNGGKKINKLKKKLMGIICKY